jgi:hypothetical protein
MKIKLVNRYCCDFCKKKKYTKAAMNNHESHCTINPNRRCRVCEKIEGSDSPNLTGPQMIAILPNVKDFEKTNENWGGTCIDEGELCKAIELKIDELRSAVNNCPVCLLAAFRQAKIPLYSLGKIFNYTDEMKSFWDDYNSVRSTRPI